MPPLPKRKTAKARQGERRSHLKLEVSRLVPCPQCREPRLPHKACPSCGYYRGKQIVQTATTSKK